MGFLLQENRCKTNTSFGPLFPDHVTDAVAILLYDRDDEEEAERARKCYIEIADETAKAGYPIYRAGTPNMARTAGYYGEAQRQMNARLKNALDPNHILAPGKSGII